MAILALEQVGYHYKKEGTKTVLEHVTMDFEQGTFYAIVGNSGAGKTTLLSLLAGLDTPCDGVVSFQGKDITEKGYTYHRKHQISLVFQNYNLIDYMTPMENIRMVNPKAEEEVLKKLGLKTEEIHRNVMKLSGGQQQRVAIGRSLASEAPVILADEPTGNLDEKTAKEMVAILKRAAHEEGKCVIVVTHSKALAKEADVLLELKNKTLKKIEK